MNAKQIIRRNIPDIKALRKVLSMAKVQEYKRYTLRNDLILKGEQTLEGLATAIEYCRNRWPAECMKVERCARYHYERAGKDLDLATLDDILFCRFAYGFNPDEYLCFDFSKRSYKERRSFLSARDTSIIVYSMNDIVGIDRYYDKWLTYEKYSEYYKRDAVCISSSSDYKVFSDFVDNHDRFVRKSVRLSKGKSVSLVDCDRITDKKQYFDEMLLTGKSILEEPITQSQQMASFNSSSVNTVRCITVQTRSGIEIFECFMKVGRAGSFVDNGGAGGLLIGIDIENGVTCTCARDEFGNSYAVHPDNGMVFEGQQLPDWNQALSISREASGREHAVLYIGWDLAHTNDGWIIVEGNGASQLIGPQIVYQRGMKKRFLSIANSSDLIMPLKV